MLDTFRLITGGPQLHFPGRRGRDVNPARYLH